MASGEPITWRVLGDSGAALILDFPTLGGSAGFRCLSDDDVRHASHFKTEMLAYRALCRRVWAKTVLSRVTGVTADQVAIFSAPEGKPRLADRPNCGVSTSSAGNALLVAWNRRGDIGCDLVRISDPALAVLVRGGLLPESCPTGQARGWARLEATAKLSGRGLAKEEPVASHAPRHIDMTFFGCLQAALALSADA